MTWLTANAGTILVLVVLLAVVGYVIYGMVSDRRKGITACDSCVSVDACAIHAAGKTCGNPQDKFAEMEPQVKKVRR
ncbi:MAG: FeoB-associated Cys-rich membrane protein [Clostridia bacterium]|nr:FeoB-associated Cys-rich membrane protein [Clostridia bacterium]MBR1703801.1 FeoB-associated Cys-rich membrane protein [Clostridia bacterium]